MPVTKMIAPIRATIANDLAKQIGELVFNAHGYLSPNDFSIRRLNTEIDKLMKVDAASGHMLRANLIQLTGDENAVRRAFNCVEKLSTSPAVQRWQACTLINLGYFSEAQKVFSEAIDYRRGELSNGLNIGFTCGAFSTMAKAIEHADRMNIEIPQSERTRVAELVAILGKANITDEQVGAMLDVAGVLLRNNKLFFYGREPSILATDDADLGSCVYLTFNVAVSPEKAAEMQFDLTCHLVEQFPDLPAALSIGFQSVTLQ